MSGDLRDTGTFTIDEDHTSSMASSVGRFAEVFMRGSSIYGSGSGSSTIAGSDSGATFSSTMTEGSRSMSISAA